MTIAIDFPIAQGDLLPTIKGNLRDIDGTVIALDTDPAPAVYFSMRQQGYPIPKIYAVAQINDALAGAVEYVWQAGDTDRPGIYLAFWRVVFPVGRPLRIPNDGFLVVGITPE